MTSKGQIMGSLKFNNYDVDNQVDALRQNVERMDSFFESGVTVYGAGFLGKWASRWLLTIGAKVCCFIDRDPAKMGKLIGGVPVLSPDSENIEAQHAIFIASRHMVKTVQKLITEKNPQAANISFDAYFVVKNYERLCNVRDQFLAEDTKSVNTFNAILIAMLTSSVASCLQVMEKDMYFVFPDFSGTFEDTFVDAGAFVGDTVERFIWENLGTFRHIYAFEPGKRQYQALQKRLQRLSDEWAFDLSSVSTVRAGLSSKNGSMICTFTEDAPLRHGLDADDSVLENRVDVLTLDSYLKGRPVNFIKADVEGMEGALLIGAEQTIRRYKPKMALCVYHYPSDLYEIVELVHKMVPEYRFRLRQHAPLFGDFVLYCNIMD